MALVIKLIRSGHKRNATYSILVVKKKGPGSHKVYEKLGYVGPNNTLKQFKILSIDRSRLAYWLSKGVVVGSCRLKKLLVKNQASLY